MASSNRVVCHAPPDERLLVNSAPDQADIGHNSRHAQRAAISLNKVGNNSRRGNKVAMVHDTKPSQDDRSDMRSLQQMMSAEELDNKAQENNDLARIIAAQQKK